MISVAIGPPVKLCVAATPETLQDMANPAILMICLIINVFFSLSQRQTFPLAICKGAGNSVAGNIILDDVDAELEAVLMVLVSGICSMNRSRSTLILVVRMCTGRLEHRASRLPDLLSNRQYMSCGLRAFLDYVKTGQSARVSVTDHNNYLLFALRARAGKSVLILPAQTALQHSAPMEGPLCSEGFHFREDPRQTGKAVKAKHQIPTVIARGLLRIRHILVYISAPGERLQ